MRFVAILNRHGGTLRTLDLDLFAGRMKDILEGAGHTLESRMGEGKSLSRELERAASDPNVDAVIAGGGDGTVSAAAAALKDKPTALAILPAGTMNLFARSLGIPLDLEAALRAFADGEVRRVDVASANGRVFVHQFSVGMHAKMVSLRDSMEFRSRLGKLHATARAAIGTLMDPPLMKVTLLLEEDKLPARTNGIGITNNLFGEGHLPYAAQPDGGWLGIYITSARTRAELVRFFLNMALGRWRDNAHVEIRRAKEVTLKIDGRRRKGRHAVIDGELSDLEPTTVLRIHPGALRVLVPREGGAEAAG